MKRQEHVQGSLGGLLLVDERTIPGAGDACYWILPKDHGILRACNPYGYPGGGQGGKENTAGLLYIFVSMKTGDVIYTPHGGDLLAGCSHWLTAPRRFQKGCLHAACLTACLKSPRPSTQLPQVPNRSVTNILPIHRTCPENVEQF